MGVFLNDTFTDTNGTNLTAHTGETGATWSQHPSFSGAATIQSNRALGGGDNRIFYAAGTPGSANYTVAARLYIISGGTHCGVAARMSTSTSTWYTLTLDSGSLKLFKSASSQLASTVSMTPTVGETYILTLDVSGSSTTAIAGRVQRLSDSQWLTSGGTWQSGQTNFLSVNDSSSPVTSAGKAGIWLNSGGVAIDSVVATDDAAATLVAGTASTTSSGNTIATVTATDASGGTSPYTYQWQRSTTSGSGFSNVSGATSLTLNDTGLTNGTTYYYRLVYTDSAAASVTSNETTASPVANNDFAVNNSFLFLSPYNWRLSGSTYAETNNPGAYLKTKFSGASCTLLLDTTNQSSLSSGNYPAVAWQVNGGAWQRSQLTSGQTTLSLATGLGSGPHTLELVVVGAWWQSDRWNTPVSAVRITGLRLASGGALSAPTLHTDRLLVFADSNGEGYEALSSGVSVANQDANQAFPIILGRMLACEVGVVAFAGQGYNNTGGGNVTDLEDAWDFYMSGQSRVTAGLLSPPPTYIVSTHGQNDSSGTQAAAASCITQWLTAAPNAKIMLVSPMNLTQASAISAAVTAAANSKVKYTSPGDMSACSNYVNGSHLSLRGHHVYASLIAGAIKTEFPTGQASTSDEWTLLKSIAVSHGLELVQA